MDKSITKYRVIWLAGLLICVIIVVPGTAYWSFLNNYIELDRRDVSDEAERTRRVFLERFNVIETKVSDWGAWDEAFRLVADNERSFIKTNITANVVDGLQISLLAYLAPDMTPLTTWIYEQGILSEVKAAEFDFLQPTHPLIQESGAALKTGYVSLRGRVALAVAKTVSKSDGSGPPAGRVIFVRWVDEAMLKSLMEQTHLPLRLRGAAYESPALSQSSETLPFAGGDIVLYDDKAIASLPLIDDRGHVVDTFVAEIPREILKFGQQGSKKIAIILGCLLAAILLGIGLCFRLFGFKKGLDRMLDANRILKERESHLRALVDSVPGYVSWFNRSLVYLGVNNKLAADFKASPDDFIGRPLGWQGLESSSKMSTNLRSFFESSDQAMQFEMFAELNGDIRRYLVCFEKYQRGESAVAVGIDTTDLWRAEQRSANDRMLAMNAARLSSLGEMAAGIAHEINNPLSIIIGAAWKLQKPQVWDQVAIRNATIDLIQQTATRITKVVNGLRTLSRDGTNDPMVETPVQSILDEVMIVCSEKFYRGGIDMRLNTSAATANLILCRQVQIGQVLINLLSNSYDAVSVLDEKWVDISVTMADGFVSIAVTDSGKGIPSEVEAKMMNAFFTTKPVGRGTGLGLSIASSIVKEHGGQLIYDRSSPNTRFEIRLPAVEAVEDRDEGVICHPAS